MNHRTFFSSLCLILASAAYGLQPAAVQGTPATQPALGTHNGVVRGTPATQSVTLTFLHINDSHGRIMPYGPDGQTGGYARLATLIARQRSAGNSVRTFLVHAGDVTSRGDALSMRRHGIADILLMNQMGFDVMTPGNGEFYMGLPMLGTLASHAKFPMLTGNLTVKSGQCLARPYVIDRAGPVRVAFFGLCTVKENPQTRQQIDVAGNVETARKLVPLLRKQADVVVAVTHIGTWGDMGLAAGAGGIDLIIGGHDHNRMDHGTRTKGPGGRDVLIVQAGEYVQNLGRVDMEMHQDDQGRWQIASTTAQLIKIDNTIPEDPAMNAAIARIAAADWKPPAPVNPAAMQPTTRPASRPTSRPVTRPVLMGSN
ncbi:MAG: metallophosphoesterase [Planctomycetaceae bacterium]|nr:metallophosphoesterase [Planctomycetaceae bacterium]